MSTFNQDLHQLVELKMSTTAIRKVIHHFNEKYQLDMEQVMFDIYDELCPDDEIRPISEYLASQYIERPNGFDVPFDEGVLVHLDDFAFKEGRLVLIPDPARIILQSPETYHREVLWQAA